MKPKCLSSDGLLSEVGSCSEASHRSLSRSSFQQPYLKSHGHHCPWTRQAPKRGGACRARLVALPAGFRLVGEIHLCPAGFWGEDVIASSWKCSWRAFPFFCDVTDLHIFSQDRIFPREENLHAASSLPPPSLLSKSHAAEEEAPAHARD